MPEIGNDSLNQAQNNTSVGAYLENADNVTNADTVNDNTIDTTFVATDAEPNASRNPQDTTGQCVINDTRTPILVLFGPSQCGKSMTMVRLVRYLRKKGFTVEPRRDFRPGNDTMYEQRCNEFNRTIDTYAPLPGNSWDDYMLASVLDSRGNSVLQILEGPGEAYFSLKTDNPVSNPYPAYFSRIKNCEAPKIWCFFTEPDWRADQESKKDPNRRAGLSREYVERIRRTRTFINLRRDKIIILCNKIDTKTQYITYGRINQKGVQELVDQQYNGLFAAFRNTRLIEKWTRPYLCEFVPFSTGDYADGSFTESSDVYPAALLNKILRHKI